MGVSYHKDRVRLLRKKYSLNNLRIMRSNLEKEIIYLERKIREADELSNWLSRARIRLEDLEAAIGFEDG